jgi:hypothetical protein
VYVEIDISDTPPTMAEKRGVLTMTPSSASGALQKDGVDRQGAADAFAPRAAESGFGTGATEYCRM